MGSSAVDPGPVSDQVGDAFKLLMQLRMLTASITLLLLPAGPPGASAFVPVACVVALSWLAAAYRQLILPPLLAHPLLVVLDIAVCFMVLQIGGTSGPFLLSTIITAAVAGLLFRWPGMVAVSALQIACYYLALALELGSGGSGALTYQELVGQPICYPLVGFGGTALRRLFDRQAEAEAARLRAEAAAAAAEERTRLARDMHDSLAKTLRGIALAASALPSWIREDPDRAQREARALADASGAASHEARCLIWGLRENAATLPLPDAVRAEVRTWAAEHGVAARCAADVAADLPLRARYEMLAILSEALANVARHAAAGQVEVSLAATSAEVVLTVRDDGRGFRPHEAGAHGGPGHYGLVGLRERAGRIGGEVCVESRPGAGTTVTARVPAAGMRAGRSLMEVL